MMDSIVHGAYMQCESATCSISVDVIIRGANDSVVKKKKKKTYGTRVRAIHHLHMVARRPNNASNYYHYSIEKKTFFSPLLVAQLFMYLTATAAIDFGRDDCALPEQMDFNFTK